MRMGDQWLPRKPLPHSVPNTKQVQVPQKPIAPAQPQVAHDDFEEEESSTPTQPLPSLAARLQQLRSPWDRANVHSDPNTSREDLDIEDDEPPLTTRSLYPSASKRAKEPPLKRTKITNDTVNTSATEDIDDTEEASQPTDSGFIVKTFFGGRTHSPNTHKRKQAFQPTRHHSDGSDDDGDDDIEQVDAAEEKGDKDRRDTNFLMNLVSPFKTLPVYNNRDPIVEAPKYNPSRRLIFVEAKGNKEPKEIKEEIKQEHEDIEEASEDVLGTPQKRTGRSLLLQQKGQQASQSSDYSQSLASQHSSANSYASNSHTNTYINSNNNNKNDSNNNNNNSSSNNTQTASGTFIKRRRRPEQDPIADDIVDPNDRGGLQASFKPAPREDIEDVTDASSPDDTYFVKQELTDDEEIEERNSTAWRDGEESIRSKLLHTSPKRKPTTGSTMSQWVERIAASGGGTQQPTQYTGSSPKCVRNGIKEKVVRVMRQHYQQHQSDSSSQASQQREKLHVIALQEPSTIQPHVSLVLSLLITEQDLSELVQGELDVMQEECAFFISREPIYVVYSLAASHEMLLKLGSVVTLENWQEIHLSGLEKRTFLSFKANSPGSLHMDAADPHFSSFMRQIATITGTSSTPPLSSVPSRVSVVPVYPTINQDAMELVQTPDSPSTVLTPPPKPSLTPLYKLHPLSQNFTIEAIVQRCFFREFSSSSSPKSLSNVTPSNSSPTSKPSIKPSNNASSTVSSLCDIMKKRMSLSHRNVQAAASNTSSDATSQSDASPFQMRKCSVLLQDDSGATAELVIPDEYAFGWKDLFIEGEGFKFALENLQVVKKEPLISGSPLYSLVSPLNSDSHVLLTVVKNSNFRRIFDDNDASQDPHDVSMGSTHVAFSPEPLCDVKTLLDSPQAKRVSILGKIVYIDHSYKPANLLSTAFCTINIFDGSVDSTFGVNNIGVFVRGVALTSLVSARIIDVGTVIRIKSAICSPGSTILDTDYYTTVEKIRLPFSPTPTPPALVPVAQTGRALSSRRKANTAKPPPSPPTSNSSAQSTVPVPTQGNNLIYHNSLARLLEIPFTDHERLARLLVEVDFAEISPQNCAAVRDRFRHCLVYLRGPIQRHIEEIQYVGCSGCFQELSSPGLSDDAAFCTVCSLLQPIQCVSGTFGVAVSDSVEAQIKIGYNQLATMLSALPKPIDIQTYITPISKLQKLYALLQKHTIQVPCSTFDGKSFHAATVKGAVMCLK